jgi:hypothetical protein
MQIYDAQTALDFVKGGKAVFTLVSLVTGKRKTFRVRKGGGDIYFVDLLTGPDNREDYAYIGFFRSNLRIEAGKKGNAFHPAFAAIDWLLIGLASGRMPRTATFWHEGKCARCGRPLTNPESIESGFGPECVKRKETA